MVEPKNLDVNINFKTKDDALKQAHRLMEDFEKSASKSSGGLDKFNKGLKDTSTHGNAAKDALGGIVKQIGGIAAGVAVFNAISNSISNYVQKTSLTQDTSREWMTATEKLNGALLNVGKNLAEIILPAYKEIAAWADKIAGKGDQAGKAGGGVIGGAIDTWKQGLGIEAGTFAFFKAILEGKTIDEAKKAMGAGARDAYTGLSGGSSTGGNQFFDDGKPKPAGGPSDVPLQQLQMMYKYRRQEEEAQKSYNVQKFRMQRDFNIQDVYATQDYNRQRTRANRDFGQQVLYADQDFYRQRRIAARDFGIQMTRSEQDFQRQRGRASQDHQFDLFQIALSGDAMQYYLSERQYKIDQTRATEDFNLNKARSAEDFNRSQADDAQQFSITQARQKKQFAITQGDQAEDFKIERERAKAQYDLQQGDLDYNFKEQKRLRDQARSDEMTALHSDDEQKRALLTKFTQFEIDSYTAMLKSTVNLYQDTVNQNPFSGTGSQSGSGENITVPHHAKGGYTSPGMAMLHDGEFVLTASTTRAAERMAKNRQLTQDTMMGMLGSNRAPIEYNDHRTFSNSIPESERLAILNETKQMLLQAIPG